MRRKLRLTALILCLALLLGACAGKSTQAEEEENEGPEEKQPGVEVVVEKHTEPELSAAPEEADISVSAFGFFASCVFFL